MICACEKRFPIVFLIYMFNYSLLLFICRLLLSCYKGTVVCSEVLLRCSKVLLHCSKVLLRCSKVLLRCSEVLLCVFVVLLPKNGLLLYQNMINFVLLGVQSLHLVTSSPVSHTVAVRHFLQRRGETDHRTSFWGTLASFTENYTL